MGQQQQQGSGASMNAKEALEIVSAAFGDLESLAETVDTFDGDGTEAEVRLANYPELEEAFSVLRSAVEQEGEEA